VKRRILACALAGFLCSALAAQAAAAAKTSKIESAGTYVAIALPVVAGGIAVWKDDWTGVKQLAAVSILTVGTAYALKHFVREQRPDHSDFQSFPSDTSALASAPAAFLWQRYGWEYGLPAFAASTFVGYSRVHAKKHHFWDVLASTAISIGYNELITTRFHPRNTFYSSLDAGPDGVYASLHYTW
jgi:membrane-associated phospholipid phosphatase